VDGIQVEDPGAHPPTLMLNKGSKQGLPDSCNQLIHAFVHSLLPNQLKAVNQLDVNLILCLLCICFFVGLQAREGSG